jgi:hypothetical protein
MQIVFLTTIRDQRADMPYTGAVLRAGIHIQGKEIQRQKGDS